MKLKTAFFVLVLAAFAVAGPVSHFGYLKTCKVSNKGRICGSLTGSSPVMVKGPSLFWSSGTGSSFYKREVLDFFVDYMEIGVVRAAMAIKYNKEDSQPLSDDCSSCYGYLSDPSIRPTAKISTKALIKSVIDAAIANDIYVIVDWHSHNANNEKAEAVAFFKEMAEEYPNTPNIIWEIYNEPVSDNKDIIKSYADAVISAIRSTGNENLVVVGSNFYSQKPEEQAKAGITDSKNNTAYSFHFYSNEHGYSASGGIGGSANGAIDAGYAVFATEWGSVKADGSGGVGGYPDWITFMDGADISGCYWNASAINEGSSIFKSNTKVDSLVASTSSNYTNWLTQSGTVFKTYMGTKKWSSYAPATTNPRGKDFSVSLEEGDFKTWSATDLGLGSGVTVKSAEIIDGNGTVTHTSNSITYTSEDGSASQTYIRYVVTNGTKDIKQRIVVNITGLKPILPKQDPIDVSHRAPWKIKLTSLGGKDQGPGSAWNTLEFSSASVDGGGTAAVKGDAKDTVIFTPPASIYDKVFEITPFELTYKIKSTATGKISTQSITLNAQNFRPSVPAVPEEGALNWSLWASIPNTAPYTFRPGSDRDGDELSVVDFYMPPTYPGMLVKNEDGSLTYTPEPNKKGAIRFLVVVTDGNYVSNVGGYRLTLTGDGDQITANDVPTEIPGYEPPVPVKPTLVYAGGLSLQTLGNGKLLVNFAKSGAASLDIYSISGKKTASLMNGYQNAGSQEFSISNLQKGVYIVRLKQGSEVKIQRVVIR